MLLVLEHVPSPSRAAATHLGKENVVPVRLERATVLVAKVKVCKGPPKGAEPRRWEGDTIQRSRNKASRARMHGAQRVAVGESCTWATSRAEAGRGDPRAGCWGQYRAAGEGGISTAQEGLPGRVCGKSRCPRARRGFTWDWSHQTGQGLISAAGLMASVWVSARADQQRTMMGKATDVELHQRDWGGGPHSPGYMGSSPSMPEVLKEEGGQLWIRKGLLFLVT